MKACKHCGQEVENTKKKCPSCGSTELIRVCDNCGEHFEGNFCPKCGVKAGQKGKVCPECQTEYFSNACPNCGYTPVKKTSIEQTVVQQKNIYVSMPASSPSSTAATSDKKAQKPKKKRRWWLWVLAALLVIGFFNNNSTKKNISKDSTVKPTVTATITAYVTLAPDPDNLPLPAQNPTEVKDTVTPAEATNSKINETSDLLTEDSSTEPIYEMPVSQPAYNENLNGRGLAEAGQGKPQYENVIGFAAVYLDQEQKIENSKDFQNEELWVVPTYEKDKQFWNQIGTLPHKTEVIVREQMLSDKGYGRYEGYLLVERTDDGTQHYIDVDNFITKPYWTYQDNIAEAARIGYFIAEFKQVSDYYPVDGSGEKAELQNGAIVLVKGTTGIRKGINSNQNDILAVKWDTAGKYSAYFINNADLTIIK